MSWNDDLESPYLNVAAYRGSPLRVLAGPGTGKTFAIMRRVSRLLEEGENPKDMLLVTFTRMAAKELVRKVSMLGINGGDDIIATTLHSLSFSMLQREQVIEATKRTPRPLLDFEKKPLLQDLKYQGLGGIRNLEEYIKAYESAWARLQRDEPGWTQSEEERKFEQKLISWLKFHESMLIGELIPIALQYLRYNPASPYRMEFKHVIVDEYQDLNKAEQVLIDLLADGGNLTIAGDDDQSIYTFKYAHPEGITTFDSSHPDTHDEVLVDCHRCPKLVVRVAKELMSNNENRYPKELQEKSDTDGEIQILQWNGLKKEAEGLAEIVKLYVDNEGVSLGEILILAQRQKIADMIYEALQKFGLGARDYYNENILKNNRIAQEKFTLLNLVANLKDRVALRCWLGQGDSNWGASYYSGLLKYCEENGDSPIEALEKMEAGILNLDHCQPLVDRYSALMNAKRNIEDKIGEELVDECFPERLEECSQLRRISLEIIDEKTNAKELFERLQGKIIQTEIPQERSEIGIMSLHKAKGLEADLVVIPTCIDGLIPSFDETKTALEQEKQLEEDRRLFYVGITRAKKILILSSVLWMNVGMAKSMKIKHIIVKRGLAKVQSSTFLRDLGPSCPKPLKGPEFIKRRLQHA
jgi:superfamily I DNA/RNA helicase